MLPLLALLAAQGLVVAAAVWRERGRPLLIAGGVVLVSLVVVNVDWFGLDRPAADAIDELNLAGHPRARVMPATRPTSRPPSPTSAPRPGSTRTTRTCPERWGLYLQGAAARAARAGRARGPRPARGWPTPRAGTSNRPWTCTGARSRCTRGRSAATAAPATPTSCSGNWRRGRLPRRWRRATRSAAQTQALAAARQFEAGRAGLPGGACNSSPACRARGRTSTPAGRLTRGLPDLDPAITAAKQRLGV